ncbi:hypothetical protein LZ31DRAFT_81145 [Colletotrichum somersetense]|nr:hypothetical protein LZ31DRAFT_81145 [Colletotrichum somersetense]
MPRWQTLRRPYMRPLDPWHGGSYLTGAPLSIVPTACLWLGGRRAAGRSHVCTRGRHQAQEGYTKSSHSDSSPVRHGRRIARATRGVVRPQNPLAADARRGQLQVRYVPCCVARSPERDPAVQHEPQLLEDQDPHPVLEPHEL